MVEVNKVFRMENSSGNVEEENFIDLDNYKIDADIVKNINKDIAYTNYIFPFKENEEELHVAMDKPFDISILNDLRFISGKSIIPYKANKTQILAYIKLYYEISDGKIAIEEMKSQKKYQKVENNIEDDKINNAPSVRLLDSIIYQAVSKRASDIHIEPFRDYVAVRIRIDGILNQIMRFPIEMYNSVNIRIKIMANMNITLKKTPQDGKIDYEKNGESCDLRVSSIPTIHGEKIVIRVLYKSLQLISIDELAVENARQIKDILKHSNNGIILLTGPTGSGKSTTMYAMLNELNDISKNILTIEDPVEFTIDQINQINVNNKAGLTFAAGLRSILRQDPDIILVGEIRDEETAQVAIRAAITGHLVISTLHTNDAPSSIIRLIDMGVKPYLLADALVAVLAQRLIRVICPFCKEEYEASEAEKRILNLNSEDIVYKGKGCTKCSYTGYIGRKAVFEIMKVDEKTRKYICEGKSVDYIRQYLKEKGMIELMQEALQLVRQGVTTIDEYMNVIYKFKENIKDVL